MNKYFAELIGTFAIVFCGTLSIVIDQETNGSVTNLGISAVFGLIVAAMIYIFGSTSGAHFNPAVTISFAIAKKFKKKRNRSLYYMSICWRIFSERGSKNFI